MPDRRCRLCNPASPGPPSFCTRHALEIVNSAGPLEDDDRGLWHQSHHVSQAIGKGPHVCATCAEPWPCPTLKKHYPRVAQ